MVLRRPHLLAALGASVLLHGAGLALFVPKSSVVELAGDGVISVTLVKESFPELVAAGEPIEPATPFPAEQPSLLPPPDPVADVVQETRPAEPEPAPAEPEPVPVTLPPQPFTLDVTTPPIFPLAAEALVRSDRKASAAEADPIPAAATPAPDQEPEAKPAPEPEPVPKPESAPKSEPGPSPVASPRPRPANAPNPVPTPEPAATAPANAGQGGKSNASVAASSATPTKSRTAGNAATSNYPGLVAKKLRRATRYPDAARSRRLSGEVLVRFVVLRDGSVKATGIAKSSGAAILDKAALDAVGRAAPFPPIPDGRAQWAFTVPIAFKR